MSVRLVVIMNDIQQYWRQQQGFSLLEVLVVLTILSILTMIALPLYQDYRTRVKIGAEFPILDPLLKKVTEEFMLTGSWPENNAEANADVPEAYHGDYLLSVEVSDDPKPGSVILTYNMSKLPAIGENNTIVFYPEFGENMSNVNWACDLGTMSVKYRPDRCR